MIEFRKGNMFEDSAEAIVNTVNCVGVMGRGVALQFKHRFPENFKAYAGACKKGEVVPGKLFVFDTGSLIGFRWLLNFPTKRHWRGASRIEDISAGLDDLVLVVKNRDIKSVVMPPLGCGLGGLNWVVVKSLIESKLSVLPNVTFIVHEPDSTAAELVKNRKVPKMTTGRASLVLLAKGYLDGLLEPFVSLLELHKLMYFMIQLGETWNLKYKKAYYGPYSENLGHVLNDIEGHLFVGYRNDGDKPWEELSLVPGAVKDAENWMRDHPTTADRISRVLKLVEGFETTEGMELLSSVHWVCVKEGAVELGRIISAVRGWNARKARFSPRQIEVAYNRLKTEFLI